MASLGEQSEALVKGGFSNEEIKNWKQEKIFQLEQGGYETEEILKEFGYQPIEKGPIKKNMG